MVVYPTLPGKPVQSQDTLGRKLLKVCAGSNPTWIGAPSCFHSLVPDPLPSRNWPDFFALQGKTPSSDPHTGWSLPSLSCTLRYADVSLWTPPCRRWFYTESQSGSCLNAVGMTLILPGFGFDKVCETKPSCTGAEKNEVRCIRRS